MHVHFDIFTILNLLMLILIIFLDPLPEYSGYRCLGPRTYTPHFGLKLVKLFPYLVESASKTPELPSELSNAPLQEWFDTLPWESDSWDDALMFEVLRYIRGNNSLELGKWRSSFSVVL